MGKITDKFLRIAPGGYYGLLSASIRFTGDLLALLLFPDFDFTKNMISDLGVGPGAFFFKLGIILSGIVCIPFYVAFVRSLKINGIYEKTRTSSLIIFYIANTAYILIGIFPSDPSNYQIYLMHGIFAFIWVLATILFLLLFSFLMVKNKKFTNLPVYVSIFLIGCLILFLFTWVPIVEWILSLVVFIWFATTSSYLIYHKL
ncbi:MAG: DUF998 domain-containing protein [Promethearchaeota archaeon]|nr:MAG: DUF998 domain-containing protein [Candidatus Lokiarchaeota archaeon]